jgi:hypothetical protein
MQYRIERSNSDSGQVKNVRLQTPGVRTSHFKPAVREPVPSIRALSEPLSPPHVRSLSSGQRRIAALQPEPAEPRDG